MKTTATFSRPLMMTRSKLQKRHTCHTLVWYGTWWASALRILRRLAPFSGTWPRNNFTTNPGFFTTPKRATNGVHPPNCCGVWNSVSRPRLCFSNAFAPMQVCTARWSKATASPLNIYQAKSSSIRDTAILGTRYLRRVAGGWFNAIGPCSIFIPRPRGRRGNSTKTITSWQIPTSSFLNFSQLIRSGNWWKGPSPFRNLKTCHYSDQPFSTLV